jgi:hypothetical protein
VVNAHFLFTSSHFVEKVRSIITGLWDRTDTHGNIANIILEVCPFTLLNLFKLFKQTGGYCNAHSEVHLDCDDHAVENYCLLGVFFCVIL